MQIGVIAEIHANLLALRRARRRTKVRSPIGEKKDPIVARAWWLHPLLASAFPVLFLFAQNVEEQISLEPLAAPLVVTVAGAILLLLLLATPSLLLRRDPARAGLVATLLVVLFFAYGHVWAAVETIFVLHRYLLGLWLVLGILGVALALRAPRRVVAQTTGVLNVAGLILVVVNILPLAAVAARSPWAPVGDPGPYASDAAAASSEPRDVWYLVFDRYAGQPALDRIYGFDNSEFLDELRARGFYVAERSTANYLKTGFSLLSTLNHDYLDLDAMALAAAGPGDWGPVYEALQGSHAVERYLHARGYQYLHFGVRRGATYTNAAADQVYIFDARSEFTTVLMGTTLLVAAENIAGDESPSLGTFYGEQTLYQFERLERLARTPGPQRFIFSHFLLPHEPYVFNRDGTWVTQAQRSARSTEEQYLEQLRYANVRILRLVDILMAAPPERRPIILIQADEGPFPTRYAQDEEGFAWPEATDEELLEKFSILSAYYLPGASVEDAGLQPDTTPVNSFRVIFNAMFGAELPILPDRNWVFVDQRHIYDGVDVTERVPR